MNKTKISAEIVADSLDSRGNRLTSLLITFPRIILAEINTHRMLSKNTSSSRAIPFKKMVEAEQNNPFIPIAWQKEHKGMQGTDYIVDRSLVIHIEKDWLDARDYAVHQAKRLSELGEVTKQLCNRLLEPFMWTTMLITGSKEGWDNFFELRCPQYELGLRRENIYFKSKKEYQEYLKLSGFTYTVPEENWKILNKGQAEIHMMALAECIYDAVNESTPKQLQENEWHLPMISDLESLKLSTDDQIKLSVGRAANTSYTVVGDGKELTLEHAIKIHDKCKELNHSSVFEHCARAMSDKEFISFFKGELPDENLELVYKGRHGWCNNFKGFIPYRYMIDNNLI